MTATGAAGLELMVQAAERLRDLRLTTPWAITPPMPPAVAAALSGTLGVEADTALLLAVLLLCLGGSAAIFGLVWRDPGDAPPWQAALVAALLPSRFLSLFVTGEPETAMFWALLPVTALAGAWLWERPGWRTGIVFLMAIAASIGCRSLRITPMDFLAAVELAALAALIWLPGGRDRERMALAGLGAVVGVVSIVLADLRPRDRERTFASIALDLEFDARRRAGAALVAAPNRPEESLLWLRALAVSSVMAPSRGKLHGLLDCLEVVGEDCRFGLTQNTAEAVIVSRLGFDELGPVRGPLDVERLERYLTWAGRPESLNVMRPSPGRLDIRADLGSGSAILLRTDYNAAWRVYPPAVQVREDPIGYILLDTAALEPGPVRITLDSGASLHSLLWPPRLDRRPIDTGEMPIIQPEGVVDASTFAGPPFSPRAALSIFGSRFADGGNAVSVGGLAVHVLFESPTQINIQLPESLPAGPHDLVVSAAGRRTEPYPIEVSP